MNLTPTKHGLLTTKHGFFDRKGGVSSGLYESLNVGFGTHDDEAAIIENRKRIHAFFGVKELFNLYQCHSNRIYVLTQDDDAKKLRHMKADGLVTRHENQVIGVLTADCLPILLHDSKQNVIGACHAGWKGLMHGIIANVVNEMINIGANKDTIHAVIGPGISQNSYEVDLHFKKNFLQFIPSGQRFFAQGRDAGHFWMDLKSLAMHGLHETGLMPQNIGQIHDDTYQAEGRYFSYRRSIHQKQSDYGRQLSAISL